MFIRILGKGESRCQGGHACPAILEMQSGDFAVIGSDITNEAHATLPQGAGCGPDERIVRIPRRVLLQACPDIPLS